jgi:hypothetical protein
MWISWKHSAGAQKQRMAWIGVSLGLMQVVLLFEDFAFFFALSPSNGTQLFSVVDTVNFAGTLTLGYAVLRHRVFDIAFVINRTIVFTIASTLLLVIFALAEWAVDRVLKFQGRERSALVDAAIALVLITGFHRIRHLVSERVTHTFFRRWQESADRLRSFMAGAPLIAESLLLQQKFLDAIEDFGPIRGTALYLRVEGTGYQFQRGSLAQVPQAIAEDNEVVINMRNRNAEVDLSEYHHALAGEYALPMTTRGQVNGFVLIGSKPQGESFRPDELTLLAKSVHEFGLDLESLRVELLERQKSELVRECSILKMKLENFELKPATGGAAS